MTSGRGERSGTPVIREDAPVVLRLEVLTRAAPEGVWSLLAGVSDWPRWHPGIDVALLRGNLEPGTRLDWRGDGMRLRSVVEEVEVHERLSWSFRTLGARGFHRWSLEETPEGHTRVRSEEFWEGLLVRLLTRTLRRTLTVSRKVWLERLRDRAEIRMESGEQGDNAPGSEVESRKESGPL